MEQLQLLQQPVLQETILLRSLIDRALNIRRKQLEIMEELRFQLKGLSKKLPTIHEV
jgi:hypothetical protein